LNFVSKISSDEKAMEVGGDAFVTINQYYRNNLLYTNDLLSKIDQNGKEIVGKLNIGNEKIQKIENISEISDSNNMAMPFVGVIVYVQSK
jgi:hypothetical protein